MARDFDLVVIGGGINGAGIARDASGRGLRVALLERGDFGGGTSSASTKLIHGGLRYLEHYEFRLVAESLRERAVLARLAPHLIRPLRFVLPHVPGLRPAWMLRAGLWLYDRLGGRSAFPVSRAVALDGTPEGAPLRPGLRRGFAYWDAQVDDARLVIANLRSAAALGAALFPRTAFLRARRDAECWRIEALDADGAPLQLRSRTLINAGGPWVEEIARNIEGRSGGGTRVQLVKGSHIVVPRVHAGDHAYLLQNDDRRIVFILPFERDYSLIGTTDVLVDTPAAGARIEAHEIRYLLDAVNRYLAVPLRAERIVWTYAGVRPLYDDGSADPSATTRDYHLALDAARGLPLLTVYGGKITTYRRLAEQALEKLAPWLAVRRGAWTAASPLPGADGSFDALRARYPALPEALLRRLYARHGGEAEQVLGDARHLEDLGVHFGADLYEREVRYFVAHEWACEAEDVLWRRTKAGLHLDAAQRVRFADWFGAQRRRAVPAKGRVA